MRLAALIACAGSGLFYGYVAGGAEAYRNCIRPVENPVPDAETQRVRMRFDAEIQRYERLEVK